MLRKRLASLWTDPRYIVSQTRSTKLGALDAGEIARAARYATSTGEILDPNKLTAASTQLPLQSRALVTNLENGHSVCVRINDGGPYIKGRKIDVSKRAAEKLDIADSGTALVKIELIATPPGSVYCPRSKPVRWRSYDHFHRRSGS